MCWVVESINSARQNCCFHKNSTKLEMCQAIFAAYLFYCPVICPYLKRQRFPSMICPRPNCCSLACRTLRISEYELERLEGRQKATSTCRPVGDLFVFPSFVLLSRKQSKQGLNKWPSCRHRSAIASFLLPCSRNLSLNSKLLICEGVDPFPLRVNPSQAGGWRSDSDTLTSSF